MFAQVCSVCSTGAAAQLCSCAAAIYELYGHKAKSCSKVSIVEQRNMTFSISLAAETRLAAVGQGNSDALLLLLLLCLAATIQSIFVTLTA